jgi:hypothetical protein
MMGKKKVVVSPVPPPKASLSDVWEQFGLLGQGIVKIGVAVAMIYSLYLWGSGKIVWADELTQLVADFTCQFADIKRTQLEGQAADTQFRINQLSGRKALTPDEARDIALLNVRLSSIQNQINKLPDCSRGSQQQQQRR